MYVHGTAKLCMRGLKTEKIGISNEIIHSWKRLQQPRQMNWQKKMLKWAKQMSTHEREKNEVNLGFN